MKPLLTFLAATLIVVACNDEITGLGPPSDPATETFAASLGLTNVAALPRTPSGVYYLDVVVGTGAVDSAVSDSMFIDYTGYLKDGTVFDSDSNARFIAAQELIVGFKTGMVGMKEGGRRKIVIPSALGYGSRVRKDANGQILIPRQSTLVFDIQMRRLFNKVDTGTAVTLVAGYRGSGY